MEAQSHLRTCKEQGGPMYVFLDLDLIARTEGEREFLNAIMAIHPTHQVGLIQTKDGLRLRWWNSAS